MSDKKKIDAVVGIDIGEFIAASAHLDAAEVGHLIRYVCSLVERRNWIEIREPFRVLRRGTAPRPSVTQADRLAVLRGGLCVRCGSTNFLTVDHIVPLSRGGAHERSNFQCLCFRCNRAKGTRLESECVA